jgi:predicted Zn finger-like uncharacterized protein
MRIVCDNCSAKYQISDDKVRNKVFKIRCKKCSHTIVVRAGAQGPEVTTTAPRDGADDPTRVVGFAGSESTGAGDAIWYVVVNREQVGPLSVADVARRFESGEIDADTFTWAEGMSDWVRLQAVTEFAQLFSGNGDRTAAVVEEPASVFSSVEEGDEDVMVSRNEPALVAAPSESLFGGHEEVAQSPRVSEQQLLNQRNENSVLFSLDSLANQAEGGSSRSGGGARVSNTGGSEGSGLIDISALMGGGPAPSRGGDDAFGGPMPSVMAPAAPAPVGMSPMPSLVTRRRSNTGLIVAAIVAGGLLVGGGVFGAIVYMNKSNEKPAVAENAKPHDDTPATVQVGGDPPAAKPAPTSAAPQAASQAAVPGSQAAGEPGSGAVAANTPPKADERPAEKAEAHPAGGGHHAEPAGHGAQMARRAEGRHAGTSAEDAPPAAAPAPTPAPEAPRPTAQAQPQKKGGDEVDDLLSNLDKKGGGAAAPAGRAPSAAPAAAATDPMLPEHLDRTDILRVVKSRAADVKRCAEKQPGASGTVTVHMLIARTGKVSTAQINDGPFRGSPVGSCVEGIVRTFQFPQFSGDSMSVNLPFAL